MQRTQSGTIPSFDQLPDAPQDRVCPPGCWGTADSYSTRTPSSLSTGLLSSLLFPTMSIHPGLSCPRCNLAPLLNFIPLVIAQPFDLSRSLCRASLPSGEPTAPHNFLLLANILSIPSSPVSKLFMKMWRKSLGPKLDS